MISDYLIGLNREISLAGKEYGTRRISSIYIGGGTPSLLSVSQFKSIFETLNKSFEINDNIEITVECNPESVTREKLIALKGLGVNRISLGIQSLNNDNLKSIGRIHTKETALEKVSLINEYFDNLSVDFIVGLPFDTLQIIDDELRAMAPQVQHVSVYMLSVEEGTPLEKLVENESLVLPDVDKQTDMFVHACSVLKKLGFKRYEVSNFAKDGHYSNHNTGYWTREEYLGLGLNASSLTFCEKLQKEMRFKNTENFENYLLDAQKSTSYFNFDREVELLSDEEIYEEKIMLGLRLNTGVDKSLLGDKLDVLYSKFPDYILDFGDRIALDEEGMNVMNHILVEIL